MELEDIISEKILKICDNRNIQLEELALAVGFSEEYLKKLLAIGTEREFPIRDAEKIAIFLNISMKELFTVERR